MENVTEQVLAEDEVIEAEAPDENKRLAEEAEELSAALLEANIKLALLLMGTAKEKLEAASKLAEGLCAAGRSPEEAAQEVITGYPHFRAVQREIPQLAAQSGGSDDGFAAIRSIFAKR